MCMSVLGCCEGRQFNIEAVSPYLANASNKQPQHRTKKISRSAIFQARQSDLLVAKNLSFGQLPGLWKILMKSVVGAI